MCCFFLHGLSVNIQIIALTEFWVVDNNFEKSGQPIQSLKEIHSFSFRYKHQKRLEIAELVVVYVRLRCMSSEICFITINYNTEIHIQLSLSLQTLLRLI
jgi:hypothetical protein